MKRAIKSILIFLYCCAAVALILAFAAIVLAVWALIVPLGVGMK